MKDASGLSSTSVDHAGAPSAPQTLLAGVNVCVVGGGFVGLVAATGFAHFGHSVVCVEKDPERLATLQAGQVPFYERDLQPLLRQHLEAGALTFSSDLAESVKEQKAIFLAVGTPASSDGRTDHSALDAAIATIAEVVEPGQVVVLKSTVPVGTGRRVKAMLSAGRNGDGTAAVVNNPEFLREGSALYDFLHPQRIVVGGSEAWAVDLVSHIYRIGMKQNVPIVTTNNETAEMIKYASNAFLATRIGFVNELAGLCDRAGINVLEVARAMGMDSRIGPEYLIPGPGWGGSCLGKDLDEYEGLAEAMDYQPLIARAVRAANQMQHELVIEKTRKLVGELKGARLAVLGLAFKAETSDLRDSPAVAIVQRLVEAGAEVVAYDPQAMDEARGTLSGVAFADDALSATRDADGLLILTEWSEFQSLNLAEVKELMRGSNIVDARNLLIPEIAKRYGFAYESMGQV